MAELTIAVLTDLHCDGSPRQYANMRRSLRVLKSKATDGIDVLLMAGDYTFTGQENDAVSFRNELTAFIDPKRTAIVPACGNHDTCWKGCMRADGWDKVWSPVLNNLAEDSDGEHGNYHIVVGGYHFLTVEAERYNPNLFTDHTASWLHDTLTAITAADPERYVFVATHGAAEKSGIYGADPKLDGYTAVWGNSPTLYDMLCDFPQAVLFTGHTHYSLENERSIMQRDFTAVNAGGVSDIASIWKTEAKGWLNSDFERDGSQGLLVTVTNGAVKMQRIDFVCDRVIGEWQLPAPLADGTHLQCYRDDRDPKTGPDFDEKSVKLTSVGRGFTYIEHSAAKSQAQILGYHYKLVKDGQEKTFSLFSEWENGAVFLKLVRLSLPQPPFEFTVTAEDIWGNKGRPLVVTVNDVAVERYTVDRLPDILQSVTQGTMSDISVTFDNITVTGESPKVGLLFSSNGVPEDYSEGENGLIGIDLSQGKITCHPFNSGIIVLRHPALQYENAPRITLKFYEDENGGIRLTVAASQKQFDIELPNFFFWAKSLDDLSSVYAAVSTQDVTVELR